MFSVASNKQDTLGILYCKHWAAHTLAYKPTPWENKLRDFLFWFVFLRKLCMLYCPKMVLCIPHRSKWVFGIPHRFQMGILLHHIVPNWLYVAFCIPHRPKWAFCIPHRSKWAFCLPHRSKRELSYGELGGALPRIVRRHGVAPSWITVSYPWCTVDRFELYRIQNLYCLWITYKFAFRLHV